jgi:hypothetical protein
MIIFILKKLVQDGPQNFFPLFRSRNVRCVNAVLELCSSKQTKIIDSIVMGDGTMVLYYDPESKRESMEWRYNGEVPPRKVKVSTKNLDGVYELCNFIFFPTAQ